MVDLEVEAGDFFAISGPSGSGKTTLLHLAALLDRPSAGEVVFDGRDTSSLSDEELSALRARAVGLVFQQYHLLPHRSAHDNVLFRYRYVNASTSEARVAAEAALERVGLERVAERPARLLSGGEKQRVAIARAIALEPRLLVADEPTGNLDRDSAQVIMDIFRSLHEDGLTILMATHNEELLRFSTRQAQCRDGCLHPQ